MKTPGVDVDLYVYDPIVIVLPATHLSSEKADMSKDVGGLAVAGGLNVSESPVAAQPVLTILTPRAPSSSRICCVPSLFTKNPSVL